MKLKLSERRVQMGETQRAVLDLLRTQGPMQQWQLDAALGRDCKMTTSVLVKRGHIERYQDDNRNPNPVNKMQFFQVWYYAFVRDLDKPKGVKDSTLRQAAKVLRAAGWTVVPPTT